MVDLGDRLSGADLSMIRAACADDAPALYRICLRTGAAGGDAAGLHADPDLLGEAYVGPYLHVAPAFGLVAEDDDGRALGYVLGTPDTAVFETQCEATWWPSLRTRYPLSAPPGMGRTPADQALIDHLHRPTRSDPGLARRFPAHLHIDLLPEAQGRGLGRQLIEGFLPMLERSGSPGVHVGVDPRNTGAMSFYQRLGFTPWAESPGSVLLVRPLFD